MLRTQLFCLAHVSRKPTVRLKTCLAAVASYLLFALGALVEEIEPWRFLSPFQHALGTDPILNGMSAAYAVAMVAVGVTVIVLGSPLLERRDIAT